VGFPLVAHSTCPTIWNFFTNTHKHLIFVKT
jgi:hypothetical protein